MYTYDRLLKTLTCVTRLGIDNRPEGGVSPLSRAGGSEINERERGGSRTIGAYDDMRHFTVALACACRRHDIYHQRKSFFLESRYPLQSSQTRPRWWFTSSGEKKAEIESGAWT